MKRVCKEQLLNEIWYSREEQILGQMVNQGWKSCPYSFSNFKSDMMARELLVDERTIRNKWTILVSNKVIRETVPYKGELEFMSFRSYMKLKDLRMLISIIESTAETSIADGVKA